MNLLLISSVEFKEILYENVIKLFRNRPLNKDTFDLYFKLDSLNRYMEEHIPG